MNRRKNSFVLALISTSLILLLVLQYFWLRKEFRDQKSSFLRETHSMFRNTVFELSDSMLMKNIKPLDSLNHNIVIKRNSFWKSRVGDDTTENIQVFITSAVELDSVHDLKPIMTHLMNDRPKGSFVVSLTRDSLNLEDIESSFRKTLNSADIALSFQVHRTPPQELQPGIQPTEDIMTPTGGYRLSFNGVDGFVLKKILPQLFFSIFLTLLTLTAFILMYQSMILQQRLVDIKNGFISNMTHELKTPITTVGVALEALKSFKGLEDPQRTKEYLSIAETELNRLSLLTDKVLKAALFENEKARFRFEVIDLQKMVEQVLQSMRLVVQKQNATIEFLKEGEDFKIEADADHMLNVIYNLIDNALKYSRDGAHIKLSLSASPGSVVFKVEDNGIGIPKHEHKKVFEKFYRVPTGDIHNTKGYGLGLNYVEGVIKGHGGSIHLTSEPNRGSLFTVQLPRHHED